MSHYVDYSEHAGVNVTVPAGNTVSNTASETNFASKVTITADSLAVGHVLRVTAYGTYSTHAATAGTITLRLKAGSTTLASSDAVTNIVGLATRGWKLDAVVVVTAIGASGNVEANGMLVLSTALSTSAVADMENTAAVTLDTTADQDVQLSVQMSVASSSNTVTLRALLVEKMG